MHPNINSRELFELTERIKRLTLAEQVYLIELVTAGLRKTHLTDHEAMGKDLAEMAADPAVQTEIALWSGADADAPR